MSTLVVAAALGWIVAAAALSLFFAERDRRLYAEGRKPANRAVRIAPEPTPEQRVEDAIEAELEVATERFLNHPTVKPFGLTHDQARAEVRRLLYRARGAQA